MQLGLSLGFSPKIFSGLSRLDNKQAKVDSFGQNPYIYFSG
jgi:hypothetical protein